MTSSSSPRRAVLRWLGFGALGAAAAAARPAAAFQVLPPGDYAAMVDNSCGSSSYHRQLLEEAENRLGVTLSQTEKSRALAAMRCPLCGCPLVDASANAVEPSPATDGN